MSLEGEIKRIMELWGNIQDNKIKGDLSWLWEDRTELGELATRVERLEPTVIKLLESIPTLKRHSDEYIKHTRELVKLLHHFYDSESSREWVQKITSELDFIAGEIKDIREESSRETKHLHEALRPVRLRYAVLKELKDAIDRKEPNLGVYQELTSRYYSISTFGVYGRTVQRYQDRLLDRMEKEREEIRRKMVFAVFPNGEEGAKQWVIDKAHEMNTPLYELIEEYKTRIWEASDSRKKGELLEEFDARWRELEQLNKGFDISVFPPNIGDVYQTIRKPLRKAHDDFREK